MKTSSNIFALLLLLVANFSFAQEGINFESPAPFSNKKEISKFHLSTDGINTMKYRYSRKTRDADERWLNTALDIANVLQTNQGTNGEFNPYYRFMLLFPDTNIISGVYTDGSLAYPFYHNAATKIDPYHMQEPWLTSGASYVLDSIEIDYAYRRQLTDDVVDTLIISILKNNGNHLFFTGEPNFSWDDIGYDSQKNAPKSVDVWQTIKHELRVEDSTSFARAIVKDISGIATIKAMNLIGVAVSFKPGYSYSLSDSIWHKNAFYLFTSEENGDSTYPTRYPNNFNNSYVIDSRARYNKFTPGGGTFNGHFLPSKTPENALWTKYFQYENHMISFKLTTNNLGVNDLSVANGLSFYPNPSKDVSKVRYSLGKNAEEVNLKVSDISGKKLIDFSTGVQIAGEHQMDVNVNDLQPGIYFYSFTVDGESINGKFVKQ